MFYVLGLITFCFIVILMYSIMLAIIIVTINYVIDFVNKKLTKNNDDDII